MGSERPFNNASTPWLIQTMRILLDESVPEQVGVVGVSLRLVQELPEPGPNIFQNSLLNRNN